MGTNINVKAANDVVLKGSKKLAKTEALEFNQTPQALYLPVAAASNRA
jgi:hypothetical protein